MHISNEQKTTAIFNIFNFSSDVYHKFHIGLSHQTYTTNFTLNYHNSITQKISHDDDQLSTKPIRQKRLEIMKMMVSEDITHDDDQLSTKPTRRKRLEIMKMMVSEDITHDDDQLSMKTTQDHEDDDIMETEEDFEEKESLFEDIVCYILYLIVGVL